MPPAGGTAIGTLIVESPAALPSGTVVQTAVIETYSLASGQIASQEDRSQDLVLFRAPSTSHVAPSTALEAPSTSHVARSTGSVRAVFPITPSLSFSPSQLLEGSVTLDIFAGRESVRGQTGGLEPVVLTDVTGATLSVPGGSLAEDTAVTFQSAILSSFVPVTPALAALAEFAVDLSGRTLGAPATLDVPVPSLVSSLVGAGFSRPITDTDVFLLARIDRIAAIPRPVVVALASVVNDRVVSVTPPGLPGLVRGGRYVLYLATEPVGFVAGTTRLSDGTGTRAVVETDAWPFIGVAGATVGEYLVAARAGQVNVTARVTGTSLVAEGSVAVPALVPPVAQGFSPASLDLTLAGAVTTATVTPIDGSVAVSVTTQVEIQSTASIDPATVTASNVQLVQLPVGAELARPVPARLILSGSGRILAVVPELRLDPDARFRLEASNLTDTTGGLIVIPTVTFTTKADVPPSYDTRKLVFGMPDANGFVTFTGPAGTLPPGTQVLVVNEGTGEVASFTADNDGAIGGSLLASIRDRLLVTITDPLGNVITFERGEYRAPDGTTAVNSAGGVVSDVSCSAGLEACPGVELRIPPAATEDAVVMQLKALALSLLPEGPLPDLTLPDGQVAQLAAALEIKSDRTPTFTQPVDLVFPKPATAPEGASYFVVRRLTGPDGLVAYETIDVAKVEGEGADAKVLTASEPFSGYLYTQPGFSLTGLDPTGAMGTQFVNTAILYWAFDEALPGRPLGGAITGRVLRVTWNPGSSVPEYEPVAGAMVSGVDVTGEPLWATARPGESAGPNVAVSQADGTYALIDLHYQGGPVTIAARINGETKTATAFQANPQDLKSPGLQFVRHVAVADITFPAVAPAAPPSAIDIRTWTLDAEGRPAPSSGVVVAGTPVIIGATAREAQIRGAEIAGGGLTPANFAVRPRGDLDPPGVAVMIDPNFVPPQPGTYTVTVFAQPAFGGEVRATVTFRAVATAGGSLDPIAPDPPAVITARLVPRPNATGVSVSVFPQSAFTEPVKNVLGQVTLTDDTGTEVPIVLLGVGPDGPVDNVTAKTVVTSLTLQPLTGLQYGTRYTLRLTAQIVDLDTNATTGEPEPHNLAPFESSFTTFEPTALGGSEEQFTAGGLAILGDRAYVAENRGRTTNVRLYDVSDPTTPLEITGEPTGNFALTVPPPVLFPGHPADLVAEATSPLTGGPVIAVATTNLTYPYQPSNVRLYDVSDDQTWRWIGAVTLGTSPVDGQIQRIVLRGELLYAVTAGVGKGIQVVDLAKAREIFDAQTANREADPMFWEMQQRLGLEGQGFAQAAIVQTIFLDTGTGQMSLQRDLAVIDLNVDGVTQPIVVATGRTPLSIVNPQTSEVLYNGPICAAGVPVCDAAHALTSWGWTIAAGVVQGRPLAFVTATPPTGASAATNLLVVIDLTDARNPRALGTLAFAGNPSGQGLVLQGEQVFIGTDAGTLVVSVTDPASPRLVSTIAAVGGRLGFTDPRLLFGTVQSASITDADSGGLRRAALGGPLLIIPYIAPQLTRVVEVQAPAPDAAPAGSSDATFDRRTDANPGGPLSDGDPAWNPGETPQTPGTTMEAFVSTVLTKVRVIGGEAIQGVFRILQNGVEIGRQILNFVGPTADARIERGTQVARDRPLAVVAEAETPDGAVASQPRAIPKGSVVLLVDANNDTFLDDADLQAQKEGKAWAFWEADPANVRAADGLVDLATVRITAGVPISGLYLSLRGDRATTRWHLIEKRANAGVKGYLSNAQSARAQLEYTHAGEVCVASYGGLIGACEGGDRTAVFIKNLKHGSRDFLLRCDECPEDPSRALTLEYRPSDGPPVQFANVATDIRPLQRWFSIYTARKDGGSSVAPELSRLPGWRSLPDPVSRLTVLVHGFWVSEDKAPREFFPQIFKRLYWAGYPVLEGQTDAQAVLGIAWPGDLGLYPPSFYPEDEFRAFQTGVPLGLLLDRLKQINPSLRLNILAHSLGNLAVNSALLRVSGLSPWTDTYVMVQAAVPAESFGRTYTPSADEIDALVTCERCAVSKGYSLEAESVDQKWVQEWNLMVSSQNQPIVPGCNRDLASCPSYLDKWYEALDRLDPNLDPKPEYGRRWRTGADNSPWRGIFADNVSRVTMFNAYNTADQVFALQGLDQPWRQRMLRKPFSEQEGHDSYSLQYWALLADSANEPDSHDLWGLTDEPPARRAELTRKWAEKAFWFQPLSGAAGSRAVLALGTDRNIPMNSIGGDGGVLTGYSSHSYLTSKHVWETWAAYRMFVDLFSTTSR